MLRQKKIQGLYDEILCDSHHATQTIESFNHFIEKVLPSIIVENSDIVFRGKARISFHNVKVGRPSYQDSNGIVKKLLPSQAQTKKLTYTCTVFVDVKEQVEKTSGSPQTIVYRNVPIIDIPCLVGSSPCWSSNDDSQSNPFSKNAYYIIAGNRKTSICQLKMVVNKLFTYRMKDDSIHCEIRSSHENKFRSTSTLILNLEHDKCHVPKAHVKLPFVFKGNSLLNVPFSVLMTLVNSAPVKNVQEFVCDSTLHKETLDILLEPNEFAEMSFDECLLWVSKFGKEPTKEKRKRYVAHIISSETLPHITDSKKSVQRRKRVIFLIRMLDKAVGVMLGKEEADVRDSCEHRRYDLTGALNALVFRQLYRAWLKSLSHAIYKQSKTKWEVRIQDVIASLMKKFSSSLRFHFNTGIWSISSAQTNSGVVQMLDESNPLATVSHHTRCSKPVSKDGKTTRVRMVHPTDWGLMCPAESPEGQSAGLVLQRCPSVRINISGIKTGCVQLILSINMSNLEEISDTTPARKTCIYVNGVPSFGTDEPVAAVWKKTRQLKTQMTLPFDTSIVREAHAVQIFTTKGRALRPLFVASRLANYFDGPSLDHRMCLSKGYIEYLDKHEEMQLRIANSVEDWLGSPSSFSHVEISPLTGFSWLMHTQILQEHNQSPRLTYQSAMAKQSLGLPNISVNTSNKTHLFVLNHIAKPISYSRCTSKIIPWECGIPTVVAISSETSNQEDSIILSRAALERGFADLSYIKLIRVEIKEGESLCIPTPQKHLGYRRTQDYSCLGPDGIISVGTVLNPGMALVGKVNVDTEKCATEFYTGAERDGQILSVSFAKNKVLIKCMFFRRAGVGDKFSSRHGQKGVVGEVRRTQNMYYNRDGIAPDVIINPHGLPSRMTIGHCLETLFSKGGAIVGERIDATMFSDTGKTRERIESILEEHNFSKLGDDVMTSGITGKTMRCTIFMGINYYQRLKHMVIDKKHSRARGSRTLLTRQPTEGKRQHGGLRVGEMEKDSLTSHGSSNFLLDRMLYNSDYYRMSVCVKCGIQSIPKSKKRDGFCSVCNSRTHIKEVALPYSCKVLFQELMSLHIWPQMKLSAR